MMQVQLRIDAIFVSYRAKSNRMETFKNKQNGEEIIAIIESNNNQHASSSCLRLHLTKDSKFKILAQGSDPDFEVDDRVASLCPVTSFILANK